MDWVEVGGPHKLCVSMDNTSESLGKSRCLEINHVLTPGWYHLIGLGPGRGVFLEVTGGDLTGERGHSCLVPVGDQGKEFPIKEKAVLGVNLVNPSLCQVGSTDVKTHREALDNYGSDLQGLSFGSYHEG